MRAVSAGLVMVLGWLGGSATARALPPQEQEVVNPSEVIFKRGQPYVDLGHGRVERLRMRQHDGAPVYYRLVRYDAEFGYAPEPPPEASVEYAHDTAPRTRDDAPGPRSQELASRIEGNFEGWAGKTLFKLQNGQIWQQTDGQRRSASMYSPKVTLTRDGWDYRMQVEGMRGEIKVRRR